MNQSEAEAAQPTSAELWESLLDAVRALPDMFRPGQLALLTATSKVEGPVRDALATFLHERYGDELVVGREVSRGDLSVLRPDGSFVMRGEHKALYAFDAVTPRKVKDYLFAMEADYDKLHDVQQKGELQYVLSTMTWLGPGVPSVLEGRVIKYADMQRRTLARLNLTHAALRTRAVADWTTTLKRLCPEPEPVLHFTFDVGPFHGVDIGLDVHIGRVSVR